MVKKVLLIILLVILVVLLGVFVYFRMQEDTWICDGGVWVKHGNPSAAMPSEPCK